MGLRTVHPDVVNTPDGTNDPEGGLVPKESVDHEGVVVSKATVDAKGTVEPELAVNPEVTTNEAQLFLSRSSSILRLLVLTSDSCPLLSSLVICESGKAIVFKQRGIIRSRYDTFEIKR
jgi:hypothetical protein